ncbi:hypothetical protein BWD08_09965 [Neisseria animaloris]|nr:hypothetical protein BWD08_09965 [Neisseria animaloris]
MIQAVFRRPDWNQKGRCFSVLFISADTFIFLYLIQYGVTGDLCKIYYKTERPSENYFQTALVLLKHDQ